MKNDRIITVLAAVMIAAVLIGEVIVYTSSTDSFDVNASYSGGNLHYSVSVSGAQPFSVVAMDNGSVLSMTELYIYYDEGYASCYKTEPGPIGSPTVDQRYYIDQLITALAFASALPVKILSADGLEAAMLDDLGGTIRKGLVVISGALPDVVYDGDPGNLIFQWLGNGGRLYWLGNLLGAYYSTKSGIMEVSGNYQALFFGVSDCLNPDTSGNGFVSNDFATGMSTDALRHDLSLKNNRVKYGIDVTKLINDFRAFGYSDDNAYASIVLTEYIRGNGTICVLAGDLSRNQRSDLVQVISSGVTYSTDMIGTSAGSVRYGTVSGDISVGTPAGLTVYVYLGGYFPVYGRLFSL